MLLILLQIFCFCCTSYGDPLPFNPLFHPGNEEFIDSRDLAFERSLSDAVGGINVPAFPFQNSMLQRAGPFSSSLNQRFLGVRPVASSNIPVYSDAGSRISLSSHVGVQGTTSKSQIPLAVQSTKRRTSLTPPMPRRRPLPTPYESYVSPQRYFEGIKSSSSSLKPTKTALTSRITGITSGSQKALQYSATSYSPALQTGFTPITNSKKSVFKVLKSPSLSPPKKFPDFHASPPSSLSSKTFPGFQASSSISVSHKKFPDFQGSSSISSSSSSSLKKFHDLQSSSSSTVQSSTHLKSPVKATGSTHFTALTSVPALKLAQARKSKNPQVTAFGSRITSSGVNDTVLKTSVTSSVSTRVETVSEDGFKLSASVNNIRTTQAEEQLDLQCEGSRDLGWCDLGARYPRTIVHHLMSLCKDFVERTFVEVPHSFAALSEPYQFSSPADNASYQEAKERGNHDTWSWASYFSKQGSLCDVEQGFVRPEAAKDASGVWNVVVQTDDIKQRIPIEVCRKANSPCKKVSDCGLKSQCFQKYTYSHLLSLDPNQVHLCPSMKLYKFPSACVCHME